MKKITSRSIVILLFINLLLQQSAAAGNAVWTKEMKQAIAWQKVTPVGQLLVCSGNGLSRIDIANGEILWTIGELKNVPENSYESIERSPFVAMMSADRKNYYVVDPASGKIVFESKNAGLDEITDKYFLYQSEKILVIGTSDKGKNTEMVMVNMNSGKKIWSKSGAYTFTTAVRDLGSNEILMTSAFFAIKLNAETGEEIWKSPLDPKAAKMESFFAMLEGYVATKMSKDELMAQLIVPEEQPDIFLLAAQSKKESTKTDSKGVSTTNIYYNAVFMGFDIKTGAYKWESVVEMPYPLGVCYPTSKGLLIGAPNSGSLNLLSYATGEKLLGKKGGGINVKGPLAGVAPTGNGDLLLVSSNGSNSTITVLSLTNNALVFDKSVKMKGHVNYTETLPNGILIASEAETNYLNTVTGEWYSDNAIQGGSDVLLSTDDNIYVLDSKQGIVYKMDVKGTTFASMGNAPVKFSGKETPGHLELLESNIIISSDQNIAAINADGKVLYQKYFPAPGVSGVRKALLIANAVRAAYYTAAYSAYSAAFGANAQMIEVKDANTKAQKEISSALSDAFGDAAQEGSKYTAEYIQQAGKRYKATTQTPVYNLMLTSTDRSTFSLIQFDKVKGEITETISLGKDKEPVYDVDLIEGKLYYRSTPNTIECYQFK